MPKEKITQKFADEATRIISELKEKKFSLKDIRRINHKVYADVSKQIKASG